MEREQGLGRLWMWLVSGLCVLCILGLARQQQLEADVAKECIKAGRAWSKNGGCQ